MRIGKDFTYGALGLGRILELGAGASGSGRIWELGKILQIEREGWEGFYIWSARVGKDFEIRGGGGRRGLVGFGGWGGFYT